MANMIDAGQRYKGLNQWWTVSSVIGNCVVCVGEDGTVQDFSAGDVMFKGWYQ